MAVPPGTSKLSYSVSRFSSGSPETLINCIKCLVLSQLHPSPFSPSVPLQEHQSFILHSHRPSRAVEMVYRMRFLWQQQETGFRAHARLSPKNSMKQSIIQSSTPAPKTKLSLTSRNARNERSPASYMLIFLQGAHLPHRRVSERSSPFRHTSSRIILF